MVERFRACQIQVDTHSKTQVGISTQDYDINRLEVEILGRYSNSRVPGVVYFDQQTHALACARMRSHGRK